MNRQVLIESIDQNPSYAVMSAFRFDPWLMEEMVFLMMREPNIVNETLIMSYHTKREAVYDADGDEQTRTVAFHRLAQKFFYELNLHQIFQKAMISFCYLMQPKVSLYFKRAWSKKEEDSELYKEEGRYKGVVSVRASRVLNRDDLIWYLKHEGLRLNDMLDPRFDYDPAILSKLKDPAKTAICREHFAVVWDYYIQQRLLRSTQAPPNQPSLSQPCQLFPWLSPNQAHELATLLKTRSDLTHAELMKWCA